MAGKKGMKKEVKKPKKDIINAAATTEKK